MDLYELDGKAIKSLFDWLQRPPEASLTNSIMLVVEKGTDIGEALKFFEHNRPISLSGSEVAELMKPVQEVLELFQREGLSQDAINEGNKNTVYAN